MNPWISTRVWIFTAYLIAASSIFATHVLREFSLAEALAVVAFIAGLGSWRFSRPVDRWVIAGGIFGLGGLALKGVFVVLGVGADTHDMATHEIVSGHPLLVHIHHLFFNIGFLCYMVSAIRTTVAALRRAPANH